MSHFFYSNHFPILAVVKKSFTTEISRGYFGDTFLIKKHQFLTKLINSKLGYIPLNIKLYE